jgi:lysine 2,3-aminomutase
VLDIPGGYGKVPVGPNYVGEDVVEDINGVKREYR